MHRPPPTDKDFWDFDSPFHFPGLSDWKPPVKTNVNKELEDELYQCRRLIDTMVKTRIELAQLVDKYDDLSLKYAVMETENNGLKKEIELLKLLLNKEQDV